MVYILFVCLFFLFWPHTHKKVAEEAAALADGVSTALEWFKQHLEDSEHKQEELENELEEARSEAESQRRRADALDRIVKMHQVSNGSSDNGGSSIGYGKKYSSSSSSSSSSIFGARSRRDDTSSSGSGGSSGASSGNQQEAQGLLREAHEACERLELELRGAREAQAASTEAQKQAGREHAKALKEAASALSSAQEEVRRGKEVEASAEREAAKLVSKLSVYESRQDVQLGVIADSAEACANLQQQLEDAKDKISSLGETVAQLNEEVELLSTQKAKLAGDSEQYAMQVRDLVMASGVCMSCWSAICNISRNAPIFMLGVSWLLLSIHCEYF